MKTVETGKILLAAGIGTAGAWFGQAAPLAVMVAVAIVLDYITGMLAAAREGTLDSAKGAKGIYKKVGFLCLLAMGFLLDWAIPLLAERGFHYTIPVLPFGLTVAAWITLNECLSVLENLVRLGVQVPAFLVKTLKIAREKADSLPDGDSESQKEDAV